jgi:SsrA-binding protein
LLLHKREIHEMWDAVRQKGVTVIPVMVYLINGLAKIEIAIAKGKKLYDKREEIARRDAARDVDRQIRFKE